VGPEVEPLLAVGARHLERDHAALKLLGPRQHLGTLRRIRASLQRTLDNSQLAVEPVQAIFHVPPLKSGHQEPERIQNARERQDDDGEPLKQLREPEGQLALQYGRP
jgi:hypothetical protein